MNIVVGESYPAWFKISYLIILHCYYLFIWLSPLQFPELLRFLPLSTVKRYVDKSPRLSKWSDCKGFLQSFSFYHCLACDSTNRAWLYFFLRYGHKNGASFWGSRRNSPWAWDWGGTTQNPLFIWCYPPSFALRPCSSPPTVPTAEWRPCIVLCDSASLKLYSQGVPPEGKKTKHKTIISKKQNKSGGMSPGFMGTACLTQASWHLSWFQLLCRIFFLCWLYIWACFS